MLQKFLGLITRLVIGVMFAETGWGKISHIDKVRDYFTELHIPFAYYQAPMVAFVEMVGGVFLVVGFLTRWTAVPLMAILTVALITAKWADIDGVVSFATTSEFLLILLLAWLWVEGPGLFSIDGWRKKS